MSAGGYTGIHSRLKAAHRRIQTAYRSAMVLIVTGPLPTALRPSKASASVMPSALQTSSMVNRSPPETELDTSDLRLEV